MSQKSVCFINYEYPPIGAGAANACYHLAVSMARSGVKVSVLTAAFNDNRGAAFEDGMFIYRISALRRRAERSSLMEMFSFVAAAIICLPKFLRRCRPDAAVVFFGFPCGPVGLVMKSFWNIPYVISLRGGDVPGAEKNLALMHLVLGPLRRLIYKKSIAVIANSRGLRQLSLRTDGDIGVEVIPNGIDTDYFCPLNEEKSRGGLFTFLFAGRFQAQKNLYVLLEACSILLLKNSDFRVFCVGDGHLKNDLMEKCFDLGLGNHISWVSWCSKERLRNYYRSADCFVNPSIYEGMANTVLEALACGLPVIAGNCIGNDELIQSNVNGFLFNPVSAQDLAGRMVYMMEHKETGIHFGAAGREMCINRFNWEAAARQYCKLFGSDKFRSVDHETKTV